MIPDHPARTMADDALVPPKRETGTWERRYPTEDWLDEESDDGAL